MASLLFGLGAGPVAAATLQEMDYTALPGDAVQINFTFDEPVDEPRTFKTDNPARIALDFPGVSNALDAKNLDVSVGSVTSVATAEASGRTRAVVQLTNLVPFEIETDQRIVQVRLESSGSSGAASAAAGDSPSDGDNRIEKINFRRGTDGAGKVIVNLNRPSVPVDVSRVGNKIIADFTNTSVPERLRRRLDVTDFATPVKSVTTRQREASVRIAIEPGTDEFDQIAYQADKSFTIELKPLSEREKQRQEQQEPEFTGERLSLNFQDIEVRSVLQLIADFTGVNMVVSDSVEGNITLRLEDVPWDQALAIILRSKGLDKRKRGNVMWVAPAKEITARERQRAEAREVQKDLAPLQTEFIRVNYAKASELVSLLKFGGGGDSSNAENLLSNRGSVTNDARTNTLIVEDTATNIERIREFVNQLDIPVRQVEIESRVVLADSTFARGLGVQFGLSARGNVDVEGSDDGIFQVGGTRPNGFEPEDGGFTGFDTGGAEGLITDLPSPQAPTGSLGLAIGKLGTKLLQLELTAMEAENEGEVISTPHVVTANQSEAFIERGSEIPFESSDGDSVSTEFKEALLSLTVTPQITPDDRVLLDLEVSNDSIGEQTSDGPAIDTQALGTQVLVDNGETVVLGGVFRQSTRDTVNRVPFFGELPVLGNLFRNQQTDQEKSELLIFVTPKILDEQLSGGRNP